MFNTKEWTEESERLEVESKLQYLKEFLDLREDLYEISKYTILEYFPKKTDNQLTYTPKVYELLNLKLDTIEDGFVTFNDTERYLEEQMYNGTPLMLQTLILSSIVYIGFQSSENKITISVKNGYIQIYY